MSTKTIRNTIPNAAKKKRKKLIGIPPLRFHEFQIGVNCGNKGTYKDLRNYNYFRINVSSLHMPSCEVPFNQFFVLFPYGLPFLYFPE